MVGYKLARVDVRREWADLAGVLIDHIGGGDQRSSNCRGHHRGRATLLEMHDAGRVLSAHLMPAETTVVILKGILNGLRWLGTLDADDVAELISLTDVTQGIVRWIELRQGDPVQEVAICRVILEAFLSAFRAHWGGNLELAPPERETRWKRWIGEVGRPERRERRLQIAAAVRSALELDESSSGSALSSPLTHPLYLALWQSFTMEEDSPLLQFERGGSERRRFEHSFLQGWWEALANDSELRVYVQSTRPAVRRESVCDAILGWMATWGTRSVFQTRELSGKIPDLPLQDTYIEPMVCVGDKLVKITDAIQHRLEASPVVIVTADFGLGKSLTARWISHKLALEFLQSFDKPSPELWFPVYVRCAEGDMDEENVKKTVKRAMKRLACEAGVEVLGIDDEALEFPAHQRLMILLDGLDEAVLTRAQHHRLLKSITTELAHSRCRVVIFTRPAILQDAPFELQSWLSELRLEKFSLAQIEAWIERWNWFIGPERARIDIKAIHNRGLAELAAIPILLFMIAVTWTGEVPLPESERAEPTAQHATYAIYERFFRAVAAGKLEEGTEVHARVVNSSKELLKALLEQDILMDQRDQVDAMLWLMSRIAWKSYQCDFQKQTLVDHDIRTILNDELGLKNRPQIFECVQIGLLLTLQADLRGDHTRILFGHNSFREFLAVRYWAHCLERIVKAPSRGQRALESSLRLHGAPLLTQDSGSNCQRFLDESLAQWPKGARRELRDWATAMLNDDELNASSIAADTRTPLRFSAVVIGSLVTEKREKDDRDIPAPMELDEKNRRSAITSMAAWCLVHEVEIPLVLRNASLERVQLERCSFPRADLAHSNLYDAAMRFVNIREADLSFANLTEANLAEAVLAGASFKYANLFAAHLEDANLRSADFTEATADSAYFNRARMRFAMLSKLKAPQATFSEAELVGANFQAAYLVGARFERGTLDDANLDGADLTKAVFKEAGCTRANFTDTSMNEADLSFACLVRAKFVRAKLNDAILSNAKLEGAELMHAKLRGAKLMGADLRGTRFDDADLTDADLSGADVTGAVFVDAVLHRTQFAGVDKTTATFGDGLMVSDDEVELVEEGSQTVKTASTTSTEAGDLISLEGDELDGVVL